MSEFSTSDDEASPSPNTESSQRTFARGRNPTAFPAYLYPGGAFALDGIALRAACLGFVCALSLNAAYTLRSSYPQLPLYIGILSFFHFMEFWITARYNSRRAKVEAFILTSNGAAYSIAHATALMEAVVKSYVFPELKSYPVATYLGLFLIVVGQTARTLAMKHAGSNFSHYVATRYESGHRLVDTGIYAWLRHPSYFGYYWWAVGTQIMLGNLVCAVVFAAFLWSFFNNRIRRKFGHPGSDE